MPEFTVDFEVFCGTCGAGLCNQSNTRKSRQRDQNQVTVDVCEKCVERACQPLHDEIAELKAKVDDLESQIP